MRNAAQLRAEDVERARVLCLEPNRRELSRNHVSLDAKRGDVEAVDDVARRHDEPYWRSDWDGECRELVLTLRMGELPHPLFGDDVDVDGVPRRRIQVHVLPESDDPEEQ